MKYGIYMYKNGNKYIIRGLKIMTKNKISYKLDKLFFNKGPHFDIRRIQCFENIFTLIFKISLLYFCFNLYDWIGNKWLKDFQSNDLYSIFIIPLLYSLKDYTNMFNSCFVEAIVTNDYISVKQGFLYKKYDKLYLKDLNNIELYRSLFGKLFGYGTLELYAFGGYVCVPYIKNTKNNFKIIRKLIKNIKTNQKIDIDTSSGNSYVNNPCPLRDKK